MSPNTPTLDPEFDPELDLVLERVVDVPPEKVWLAWTRPEHMKRWFTPAPWSTVEVEIDLRPGGVFRSVMRSPEGEEFPSVGCCLEVVENRRLTFTHALGPGFRPTENPSFTAIVSMEPEGSGTRYVARAIHGTASDRKKHEEMGFHEGWGKALDQLVKVAGSCDSRGGRGPAPLPPAREEREPGTRALGARRASFIAGKGGPCQAGIWHRGGAIAKRRAEHRTGPTGVCS